MMKRIVLISTLLGFVCVFGGWLVLNRITMGKQPDGSFIVSSGQRIVGGAISFSGRPIDLALHPNGTLFAILNKNEILLGNKDGILPNAKISLGRRVTAGFRGLAWTPDGKHLFASTASGHVAVFRYSDGKLLAEPNLQIKPTTEKGNPVPGGMCINRAGTRLFVAAANRNAVAEIDLSNRQLIREWPVQQLPFEPRLSADEKTLVVSNWGGRPPRPGDRTAKSQDMDIVVDERGVPSTGTISLIDLAQGTTRHVDVGIHPTSLAITGDLAYVANAMSDTISVVRLSSATLTKTLEMSWGNNRISGSMPNALAFAGDRLLSCNGGDNAVCEIDPESGKVLGFRPVGYFPVAIAVANTGTVFVLNTKGNGSVAKTTLGKAGNAHDFQGSVSVVDLTENLAPATSTVAANNYWDRPRVRSPLKVYNGAIKHVVYIIKENRTYDEIHGDDPRGNGDPKLCSLGEKVMPNHRKLSREFTLFDNTYVSGTNSADGHAWCTQCLANDYLEHFYVGYSRSYPYDGDDAMALAKTGCLWDEALQKKKTLRVYGEFCDDDAAKITPMPNSWFEVWEDRKNGTKKFQFEAVTHIPSLKPYIHPNYFCWPLWQSDQARADLFIEEYEKFSKENRVPNLMILSLPSDHGEGLNPKYPTPRAMMADNDLALGRIVEAISRSPQWKETCIFVIEDDAQAGPDHVDGHRTTFHVISPYVKRGFVDSTLYAHPNLFRSIEMMLGLDPLNKFDAHAYPIEHCFTDRPDVTPYTKVPNNIPLDERNPGAKVGAMSREDEFWTAKTLSLDWSEIDAPDPYWLNRINWYSIFRGTRPYPDREGEEPMDADSTAEEHNE